MQRPPFWHREETSVPEERGTQGWVKLSGVERFSVAPDTEQRGSGGSLTFLGWVEATWSLRSQEPLVLKRL